MEARGPQKEALELGSKMQELALKETELARREVELSGQAKELDEKLYELAGLLGAVERQRVEMLEASEEEIVSFSLSITEKVLQHEVEGGRYRIAEVVRAALRAVRDKGAVVVRVNPRDHELTEAALEKLRQGLGVSSVTAVPDEAVSPASCRIETDSGKVLSDVQMRLDRIKKHLFKQGGPPQAAPVVERPATREPGQAEYAAGAEKGG